MEKINLIADFTRPFIEDNGWNRQQYINIEAFALNGYSRGVLKEIPYISPWDWTSETAKKVLDDMADTFNLYKAIDKDFSDYELNGTYIRKPRELK